MRHEQRAKKQGAVAAWLGDPKSPRVLVLSGGGGKTTAASCTAAAGPRGRILSASILAQPWRSGLFSAERVREDLATCGLLVVDDIGAEHAQQRGWVSVALRDLLELRQAAELRTILTTNLSRAELERAYSDPRLTSRLARARWIADAETPESA
ncbi:MAG TPA: hypothetical protein VK509_24920 [Polyangiales bacterium]|nr:hypothetical protein [Polyangiales bacterium]